MKVRIKEFTTKLNAFEVYSALVDNNSALLDSSKEDVELSKYSFIGVNPFLTFEAKGSKAFIDGEVTDGDPFDILDKLIEKYKVEADNIDIPFISGAIGYISYDTCNIIEELKSTAVKDFDIPDLRFLFYENIIIFDQINHKKYVTYLELDGESEFKALDIIDKIDKGNQMLEGEIEHSENEFISNFTKSEYEKAITKLKDYIISGDVYIANMTQRFKCDCNKDSYNIYKDLRTINKAPFSAYLNFADFQIVSSSPERFIQIQNGKAHTRPIKGTRPRGKSVEEDEKFKNELINSEKDKAELLMVVDLERNDFSKVCKIGTVKVTELFKLEEYATVFHLVSTVEGELKDNVSAVKCIKECFPGGSITGTPKIRAMEIIEELEGLKRNIYTGCIGYFDLRGNADFNIAIRTIIKKDTKAYFGVGGGITYDSIEEAEYFETLDKAKALMKVL